MNPHILSEALSFELYAWLVVAGMVLALLCGVV